jgi:hypothetical protein
MRSHHGLKAAPDAAPAEPYRNSHIAALGDFAGTPLGQAGADRMRGGEAYAG